MDRQRRGKIAHKWRGEKGTKLAFEPGRESLCAIGFRYRFDLAGFHGYDAAFREACLASPSSFSDV